MDSHPNILQFCGITKSEAGKNLKIYYYEINMIFQVYIQYFFFCSDQYMLVLEYADSETLNIYLRKSFNTLNWNDKLHLALQLASAIAYIHQCNIIHRDLIIF